MFKAIDLVAGMAALKVSTWERRNKALPECTLANVRAYLETAGEPLYVGFQMSLGRNHPNDDMYGIWPKDESKAAGFFRTPEQLCGDLHEVDTDLRPYVGAAGYGHDLRKLDWGTYLCIEDEEFEVTDDAAPEIRLHLTTYMKRFMRKSNFPAAFAMLPRERLSPAEWAVHVWCPTSPEETRLKKEGMDKWTEEMENFVY
jgi:hypothetical protein